MDPKYSALFTSVNLLLGVGPLILPYTFYQSGLLLSTIWMLIIILISYNSAMYIVQAMSKVSYIDQLRNDDTLKQSLISNQNQYREIQGQHNESVDFLQDDGQIKRKKIIITNTTSVDGQENSQTLKLTSTTNNNIVQKQQPTISTKQQKKYDHIQQFGILYGEKYKIIPSIIISIYLLGTAISKCIMTGNILSEVFHDINILKQYYFWLGLFFISGAAFSFKSIQNTKSLQFVIIVVRFISIVAMIIGAVYIMIVYGVKQPVPQNGGYFNMDHFANIFSNSLFALMFHHSLPGIARQVKNTTDTGYFIKLAFAISGFTLLVIPITACLAFGQQLGSHQYKFYNFDFNQYSQSKFIYYIVSFYVFLNIAAFSVYIIVIRTNILKVFFPAENPMKLSKNTVLLTGVLLVIICVVGLTLKHYIQYVLDFTGGVFGSVILFFLPCLQVYKARKGVWRKGEVKNYIQKLPLVIMFVGGLFMVFNLFQVIKELVTGSK